MKNQTNQNRVWSYLKGGLAKQQTICSMVWTDTLMANEIICDFKLIIYELQ